MIIENKIVKTPTKFHPQFRGKIVKFALHTQTHTQSQYRYKQWNYNRLFSFTPKKKKKKRKKHRQNLLKSIFMANNLSLSYLSCDDPIKWLNRL